MSELEFLPSFAYPTILSKSPVIILDIPIQESVQDNLSGNSIIRGMCLVQILQVLPVELLHT